MQAIARDRDELNRDELNRLADDGCPHTSDYDFSDAEQWRTGW